MRLTDLLSPLLYLLLSESEMLLKKVGSIWCEQWIVAFNQAPQDVKCI